MKSSESISKLSKQKLDETKPGLGQYYCIPCAKYFETFHAKSHHQRGKVHKRRLKQLKEGPYTPEEANAAAGHDVAKFMNEKEVRSEMVSGEAAKEELVKKNKLTLKQELEAAKLVELQQEAAQDDSMQTE